MCIRTLFQHSLLQGKNSEILPQPAKDLDQSLSRRSTPPTSQLQPSKPLLNSVEETKSLYSEVHIFLHN